MLHGPLQRDEGRALQVYEQEAAERVQSRARFIAAFLRQVARATNADLLFLCALAALREADLTKEDVDVDAFLRTLRTEQETASWWPEGFM